MRMGNHYKFYRLYYTLFAFIGFAGVLIYQFKIHSLKIFATNTASVIIGMAVTISGLVVMSICIVKYFMQLSGLKGLIQNKSTNKLMISGIHKHIRHPLYAATFVFIWGLLILFPLYSLLITDIIITAYTLIGVRYEERKLEKEFGDAYETYKRQVPMIIPRLRRILPNRSS